MLLSTPCELANENTLKLYIPNHLLVAVSCQKLPDINKNESLKWNEQAGKMYSKLESRIALQFFKNYHRQDSTLTNDAYISPVLDMLLVYGNNASLNK